jgi:hypothetical protein
MNYDNLFFCIFLLNNIYLYITKELPDHQESKNFNYL